jgi:cellulose synthase (UDP-forming)
MDITRHKLLNPPILKFISIISIIYFIYYLWWRAAFTLNPDFPLFSWLLWLAEAFGVFSYFLFAYFSHNIAPCVTHTPPGKGLNVDIFVPTYNEDEEILEATLIGCNKISYPHKTFVLDDGNRSFVKQLSDRMGCQYIARPSNEHAKAGNINYALNQTDGEFIVVLDADMVPQPEYLDRTLCYFKDKDLALVQLPQEFYNWDSIQHTSNKTPWHEQSLFFRVIQPGKNYTNSAFWCGSPSVIRRKALSDIGGVATETITEDIHTTVRLHALGWKTLFVNEPLAFGIAPQTITAFLIQRLRWAQGTMQLYRSKESPLWIPGLSFKQRLSYFSSFLAYLESFQKFIFISIPFLILGFDIFPMRISFDSFLLHWIPYFLLNIAANQLGGRGVFNYFETEKFNLLKTVIFIQSTITLFIKRPIKFLVTPKTVKPSVMREEMQSLRIYMIIFGTLLGSLIFGIYKLLGHFQDPISMEGFFVALFWSGYNSMVIFFALREIFRKKHHRKQYRFPVKTDGVIYSLESPGDHAKIKLIDLSTRGCGFLVDEKLPDNTNNLTVKIFPKGFISITLPVEEVVFQRLQSSGNFLVGSLLSKVAGDQRDHLFEYLFVHLPSTGVDSVYKILEWDPIHQLKDIFKYIFRVASVPPKA